MFIMFLAEKKHMTKKELLQQMDAKEFYEWVAYYRLQDETYRKTLDTEILSAQSDTEKDNALRALLNTWAPKNNGTTS